MVDAHEGSAVTMLPRGTLAEASRDVVGEVRARRLGIQQCGAAPLLVGNADA